MGMTTTGESADLTARRTAELFREQQQNIIRHTDCLFARLMVWQWGAGAVAAILISPRAWTGTQSQVHLHVLAAVFLGGVITALPVFLALTRSGQPATRHAVAVGQMLMSALLIHLTGGRIETHFHVFGSLAILAFYRDWRVLISASAVVYVDHLLRGMLWPQSVYGVLAAPVWRSLEHAGWVIFEVTFLTISIRKSLGEMWNVAVRQARLEGMKDSIEATVANAPKSCAGKMPSASRLRPSSSAAKPNSPKRNTLPGSAVGNGMSSTTSSRGPPRRSAFMASGRRNLTEPSSKTWSTCTLTTARECSRRWPSRCGQAKRLCAITAPSCLMAPSA